MDHAEGLSQYQGPTAYVMLCPRLRFNRYGRRMLHSSLVAHMVIHVLQTSSCAVYGVHPVFLRHLLPPTQTKREFSALRMRRLRETAVPLLRGHFSLFDCAETPAEAYGAATPSRRSYQTELVHSLVTGSTRNLLHA